MKTKNKLLLLITIFSTLIIGCSSTSKTNTIEISNNSSNHIERSLDTNLEVNADVLGFTSSTFPIYTAHIYETSIEQVQKAFFSDAKVQDLDITYQSEETDGEYGYKINYRNRKFHYLGLQLYINYDYYNYFQLVSYYPDTIYDLPFNFDEAGIKDIGNLTFMTKEDALKRVKDAATSLGLYLEDEPFTCIALNSDSLTKLYNYIGGTPDLFYSDEDISFENDKGCYYIVWNQKTENGESIMSGNYSANTLSGIGNCQGSYISAIVNEEGIVAFNTTTNYEVTEKKGKEKIINADAALNCIKEKYSNIILNSPITITEIKLCYSYTLVNKDSMTYEFIPTWCILSHNSADDSYSLTAVNAITGELF